MGRQPHYTDEDFKKINLLVEQGKKATEIIKVSLHFYVNAQALCVSLYICIYCALSLVRAVGLRGAK